MQNTPEQQQKQQLNNKNQLGSESVGAWQLSDLCALRKASRIPTTSSTTETDIVRATNRKKNTRKKNYFAE